jgi:hypothetical protein
MRARSPRTKKLIATIAILIWLPVYSLLAMRVGVALLPNAGALVTLLYYALAGTAWIIPVGLMLPWMHHDAQRRR